MSIKVGDQIPAATLNVLQDGIESRSTHTMFAHIKVLLFAVPGAFTPTCSNQHLPGYIKHLADFRSREIEVMCMAVNDAYVMRAWADSHGTPETMTMLADGNGTFATALGMDMDGTGFGMGRRSRRFALYAEDGVVKILHVEAPGEYRVSSAEAMLQALDDMRH